MEDVYKLQWRWVEIRKEKIILGHCVYKVSEHL